MTNQLVNGRRIKTLLIANRGEIAIRIIKAAKALGIQTVAVYSEADAQALHVRLADQAWCLGGPAPLDSYLRIDRLIEIAKASSADAIHPGYGFVSENPELPKACEQAGVVLVGPGEQAMRDMADKARAKEIATAAGLPCIPGFNSEKANLDVWQNAAADIGYPVMVKALAGGGGRGMRLVENELDLAAAIHSAQQEANNAFGDDRIMLEKAVIEPRHVEVQVLADAYGHAIHLGERDCSVQRRHQKIVEEAPSPAVDEALRARMGDAALKLVRATQYVGAGTVEFLLDRDGQFYFIEMNTRLQVEHGVTELITGIDLVQWQLKIAAGQALTLQQTDIRFEGHAIQGRLCAENPADDFLPQTGPVLAWSAPQTDYLRVDHALCAGQEVSPWYDSMLGKVMAHGSDRIDACEKLADALCRLELVGFEHNAQYLSHIVSHSVFAAGEFSTSFLADHGEALLASGSGEAFVPAEVVVAAVYLGQEPQLAAPLWPSAMNAKSSTAALYRTLKLKFDDRTVEFNVRPYGEGYQVRFPDLPTKENPDGEISKPEFIDSWSVQALHGGVDVRFELNGRPARARVFATEDGCWVRLLGQARARKIENLTLVSDSLSSEGAFNPLVKSPMNGKVLSVGVSAGDRVQAGDLLASLEAMKMEHRLIAQHDAMVEEVLVRQGEQMGQGQLMIKLKEAQ